MQYGTFSRIFDRRIMCGLVPHAFVCETFLGKTRLLNKKILFTNKNNVSQEQLVQFNYSESPLFLWTTQFLFERKSPSIHLPQSRKDKIFRSLIIQKWQQLQQLMCFVFVYSQMLSYHRDEVHSLLNILVLVHQRLCQIQRVLPCFVSLVWRACFILRVYVPVYVSQSH